MSEHKTRGLFELKDEMFNELYAVLVMGIFLTSRDPMHDLLFLDFPTPGAINGK